jgi:hypothetical protein
LSNTGAGHDDATTGTGSGATVVVDESTTDSCSTSTVVDGATDGIVDPVTATVVLVVDDASTPADADAATSPLNANASGTEPGGTTASAGTTSGNGSTGVRVTTDVSERPGETSTACRPVLATSLDDSNEHAPSNSPNKATTTKKRRNAMAIHRPVEPRLDDATLDNSPGP